MPQDPVVVDRILNAPVAKVWKALTEKDQISKWSFSMTDFKPEVGFEFKFDGANGDIVFHHVCQIQEVIPGKKLAYSWQYEGYTGSSLVTIELFPEGDKTRLRLTHAGLETFEGPHFARENFMKGWTDIIGTHLKTFVEA